MSVYNKLKDLKETLTKSYSNLFKREVQIEFPSSDYVFFREFDFLDFLEFGENAELEGSINMYVNIAIKAPAAEGLRAIDRYAYSVRLTSVPDEYQMLTINLFNIAENKLITEESLELLDIIISAFGIKCAILTCQPSPEVEKTFSTWNLVANYRNDFKGGTNFVFVKNIK